MRKVFVEVKVKLVLNMNEGVEVCDVLDEMDYDFKSNTRTADIEDMEILDYEVKDSK